MQWMITIVVHDEVMQQSLQVYTYSYFLYYNSYLLETRLFPSGLNSVFQTDFSLVNQWM